MEELVEVMIACVCPNKDHPHRKGAASRGPGEPALVRGRLRARLPRSREGGRTLQREHLPPFSGADVELLAAWAAGQIDISQVGLAETAPTALRAIVAHRYGWSAVSNAPMSWPDYWAAAQLLSQERGR